MDIGMNFATLLWIVLIIGGGQALTGTLRLIGLVPLLTPVQEIMTGVATVATALILNGIRAWLKL